MEVSGSLRNKITTLEAPKDYIPLHVRGGFIIPTQYKSQQKTAIWLNRGVR